MALKPITDIKAAQSLAAAPLAQRPLAAIQGPGSLPAPPEEVQRLKVASQALLGVLHELATWRSKLSGESPVDEISQEALQNLGLAETDPDPINRSLGLMAHALAEEIAALRSLLGFPEGRLVFFADANPVVVSF